MKLYDCLAVMMLTAVAMSAGHARAKESGKSKQTQNKPSDRSTSSEHASTTDIFTTKLNDMRNELAELNKELSNHSASRSEQAQKRLAEESDALGRRLSDIRKDLDNLLDAKSKEIGSSLKTSIGESLISAGDSLLRLGKEIRN